MEFIKLDSKTGVYHFKLKDGSELKLVIEAAMDFACDQLQDEVERLKEYTQHYETCMKLSQGDNDCTCGLDKLLKEG